MQVRSVFSFFEGGYLLHSGNAWDTATRGDQTRPPHTGSCDNLSQVNFHLFEFFLDLEILDIAATPGTTSPALNRPIPHRSPSRRSPNEALPQTDKHVG